MIEGLRRLGRKTKDWITREGKYHFWDSTALLAATNPIYSAFEVGVAKMSDAVSIKARSFATALSYLGMGWAFSRGRDLSRRMLKITDQTKEWVQGLHDVAYSGAFNLGVAPLIYLASGVDDFKQLAIGTGAAVVFGMAQGPLMGYAVDVGRDLTGLGTCERKTYPEIIRRQRPRVKKTIFAGLVAASIGLMAGIYGLTSDKSEVPVNPPQRLEQVVETGP